MMYRSGHAATGTITQVTNSGEEEVICPHCSIKIPWKVNILDDEKCPRCKEYLNKEKTQ